MVRVMILFLKLDGIINIYKMRENLLQVLLTGLKDYLKSRYIVSLDQNITDEIITR